MNCLPNLLQHTNLLGLLLISFWTQDVKFLPVSSSLEIDCHLSSYSY